MIVSFLEKVAETEFDSFLPADTGHQRYFGRVQKIRKEITMAEISEKKGLVTLLLCLLLGGLGIHRFYVGKAGTGILMIITLGGFGIWWLIDLIMIAIGKFSDKEGKIVKLGN